MFKRRYFILALDFHGATLLAKLLNAHPQITSLADTYPSNFSDQVCGCGNLVSRCSFWTHVKEQVNARQYTDHPHMLPDYPRLLHRRLDRYIYQSLPPRLVQQLVPAGRLQEFARCYQSFLTAVGHLQPPTPVFVDGVKSISRVASLAASKLVDGVIHLQRDPGDYCKSAQRQKGQNRRQFVRANLLWRFYHARAARLGGVVPLLNLRYEDLADNTDAQLQRLFEFVQVPVKPLAQLNLNSKREWHFMGNKSLFDFDGTIRRSRHALTDRERTWVRRLSGQASDA